MPLPDLTDRTVLARFLDGVSMSAVGDPEPIGDEYGFASARVAIDARLPDGSTEPVVVKVWEIDPHGLGEIEFYDEWAPRLPVRLPECHGADATKEHGLLVLEDLRPLRQGDELTPLGIDDASSTAAMLARIHLATRGMDSDLPPARFTRILPSEWHDTRRVAFGRRFGLPESPELRSIVVGSEEAGRVGHALVSGGERGLCHADVHSDNLVFVGEEPILLDWARPGWGPAAHDLASLLYSSASIEDHAAVIEAYRSITAVTDDQVAGAMLMRLVVATLGIALWEPVGSRQLQLVEAGLARAVRSARWLFEYHPAVARWLGGE